MNKKHIAYAEIVLASVFWSTAGIWIKSINLNPFSIAGFRGLIAALTIFAYMVITREKVLVNKRTLIPALFMCVSFISFVTANKLTTAANAIVLQFTTPIFIVAFQAVFFRQKTDKNDIIAVATTFFGIILFFMDQMTGGKITGNLLAIFAGICLALMYIFVGNLGEEEKMSGILFGHVLTAIAGIPFSFFLPFNPSANDIVYLLLLGVVQLGIPYILMGQASKSCSPLAISLISVVEPLLNSVWVAIFDKEIPGPFALVGAVIILTSVIVWCIKSDKKTKTDNE